MTVFVKDTANSVLSGLTKMKSGMIEDYNNFMPNNKGMCDEYANSIEIRYGKKYIKVVGDDSVKVFVVGVDNDKKFKKGDILMPAGYSAPARNAARGNILDGGYAIDWTGPLYL